MRISGRYSAGLLAAVLVFGACAGGNGAGSPAAGTPGTGSPAAGSPGAGSPAAGSPDGNGGESPATSPSGERASVQLQLQWAPQAQFAGYFAAREEGFYEAENLDVEILDGGPDITPQVVGSDPNGPEFTISWVPKVLQVRAEDQSDLVNIAQVFQRSGTLSVSWAEDGITEPADFAGRTVGVWCCGNEHEVIAAAREAGLEPNTDFEVANQPFDMSLLLNREIDVAEAMIYNEYAQVLEAENPETGELYQPEDLNVIDYNDVGTAMLQDAIFAREQWLAEEGNEDVAVRFLRASFRGWIFCRENSEACIEHTVNAGSTLGAGHQAWMMNEISPLIWPSPNGIGQMPEDTYQQTVDISIQAEIIPEDQGSDAYRTDLAEQALDGIEEDVNGADFEKGTVEVTPGGE